MKVYDLQSHDVWQSDNDSMGLFSTFEKAVAFLQGHVAKHGFSSSDEGYSIYSSTLDDPDSESKVFCTCECDDDFNSIIWHDSDSDLPVFLRTNVEGSYGVRSVIVRVGEDYLVSDLIRDDLVFWSFDSQDDFDDFDDSECAFKFLDGAVTLSVDDLMNERVIWNGVAKY